MSDVSSISDEDLKKRRVLICDSMKSRFDPLIEAMPENNILPRMVVAREMVEDAVKDFKPDLIIINLFMGEGNTLDLIKRIHKMTERQGIRILVLTSHYSKNNILECVKAGANDFVLEPFEPRMLLQRIRYQLQERESYSPDDLRAEPTQVLAGFQLLYECLKISTEMKGAHDVVFQCLKRIEELSSATRVNLYVGNLATNKGSVVASSDDPELKNLDVDLEKYNEVREVLLNGSIVHIKDITANPLTKDISKQVKSIDIKGMLVVPVRHRAETIGALSIRFGSKEGFEVSEKHLKAFYMVALSMSPKVAALKLMQQTRSNSQKSS